MGSEKIDERFLVEIWRRQLVTCEKMVNVSGDRVQVIHPGRQNRDRGPDFVGSTIAIAGHKPLRGDIEIHLRANDWKSHGHHRDPRYNTVILHVVWDGSERTELQNGKKVSTLSLRGCLGGSLDDVRDRCNLPMQPGEPCYRAGERLGGNELARLLDEAGDERFRLKAGRFAFRMDDETPSQVLYHGIMGALGYSKNKKPFQELACRLRLGVLEGFCRGMSCPEQVEMLRDLLLGTAGLHSEDDSRRSDRLWILPGGGDTMNSRCWHVFRVRPDNHPVRRLCGAACLLARFWEMDGLLEGALRLINESGSCTDHIEAGFMVNSAERYSGRKHTLIGRGRAREIVVNVVLPFAYAWAEATAHTRLVKHVLELYRGYSKMCENEITRDLTALLLGPGASGLVNSARRQQGLIHLATTVCYKHRCTVCPVYMRLHAAAALAN
jgi:hypothetical protein